MLSEWEHGLDDKTMSTRWRKDRVDDGQEVDDALANGDSIHYAQAECDQFQATTANAHMILLPKGTWLVIALALDAALGLLADGVLTKKMIPGFEAYPYFAPCLLASAVGICITGVVGLVLNETHLKWSNTPELEKTLENLSCFENMEEEADEDVIRGRSGYESNQHYKMTKAASVTSKGLGLLTTSRDKDVVVNLSVGATATTTTTTMSLGTRPKLRQTAGAGTTTPPIAICTCHPHESAADTQQQHSSSTIAITIIIKLLPATQLYLTFAIYTLLVLILILGSEFIMLYTQSPTFRGGLGFSAKTLG
ncbi:hypothetical protein BG015_001511 [Linnemannia schmuckeri]|uniref:Uncharacterized protein n=1 Tax=Linnemannia schmuckeri TaxID=64567 RepID=A0A9P5RPW6_9FUNG|nr:hypothetical protein BG015_001511 [Linnemannia schmuckeri]